MNEEESIANNYVSDGLQTEIDNIISAQKNEELNTLDALSPPRYS